MSTYYATSRTNYFRVTDEEKYQEIFSKLCSEEEIEDFSVKREDGSIIHAFGSYSSVDFTYEDDEGNMHGQIAELQKILPEGEAFIYLESGFEKLAYVNGLYVIVTKDDVRTGDIHTDSTEKARKMLGDATKEFIFDKYNLKKIK